MDAWQFVSSGYDRTLESAAALSLGLYPANQEDPELTKQTLLWQNFIVVPIHSSQPENDGEGAVIRRVCPVDAVSGASMSSQDQEMSYQRRGRAWVVRIKRCRINVGGYMVFGSSCRGVWLPPGMPLRNAVHDGVYHTARRADFPWSIISTVGIVATAPKRRGGWKRLAESFPKA